MQTRVLTLTQQAFYQPSQLPSFAIFGNSLFSLVWDSISLIIGVIFFFGPSGHVSWDVASCLSKDSSFRVTRRQLPNTSPHRALFFVLFCFQHLTGPLIGVCIFNCQIAGIPLKWVEHTLPFRVNEKRRPGRARVTDNDPGNKEGIHLQFFYFHQREKLKCILMGKCVPDFNPPSRAVFRCPILWSHTARVKQLRRN